LLTWFSECPIDGCHGLGYYPQFYVRGSYFEHHGLEKPQGAVGQQVITELAAAMKAEFVDASFNAVPRAPPMRVDQCPSCPNGGTDSCDIVGFRKEKTQTSRLCGAEGPTGCGVVTGGYYADSAAHEHAAMVLTTVLGPAPNLVDESTSGAATPSPSPGPN